MMLIDSGLSASDISTRPQGRDKRQWLYAPCDIEVWLLFIIFSLFYLRLFNSLFVTFKGHIGTDGRRYVIDFSRVFPPTHGPEVGKTYLYRVRY